MTKRSLAQSLILHTLLIIPLVMFTPKGTGNGDREGEAHGGAKDAGQIVPKEIAGETEQPKVIEVTIVDKAKPKQKHKDATKGVKECKGDAWYGGIGIQHNGLSGEVDEVVPGYPAAQAGILPGDRILGGGDDIRGEPGTEVTVVVTRHGIILTFHMVRAKVCLAG